MSIYFMVTLILKKYSIKINKQYLAIYMFRSQMNSVRIGTMINYRIIYINCTYLKIFRNNRNQMKVIEL